MAAIQQRTLDDWQTSPLSRLANMPDEELLGVVRSRNNPLTIEELLIVRREGIRRGIVAKLEADLGRTDRERLEEVRAEVGRSWHLAEEWEGETHNRGRTQKGIREAKVVFAAAKERAVQAELALRHLDKELGLQRFGRYRFTED